MKNLELSGFGVLEMSNAEMNVIDGGGDVVDTFKALGKYTTLGVAYVCFEVFYDIVTSVSEGYEEAKKNCPNQQKK